MANRKPKTPSKVISQSRPGDSVPAYAVRIALLVLVLILYGKTTGYDYTLDDEMFITKNAHVSKGLIGIGDALTSKSLEDAGHQPYRPVPMLTFIFERVLTGNATGAAHFLNILLYGVLLLLLWNVLNRLFSGFHPLFNAAVIFLFAAHPLHVEVVASVKSRDELLATLFGLAAWLHSVKFMADEDIDWKRVWKPVLFLFLAMFSKETAISFLLIIPLSIWLFIRPGIRSAISLGALLAVPCALFLLARYAIVGNDFSANDIPVLANVLNAAPDTAHRTATKSVILWYWLKMSVLPWPLSWDYAFNQIPVASWNEVLPWVSLAVVAGLVLTAMVLVRRSPVPAFCILAFFIASTPTNNVLLEHASTFGERFMFISTIPFCLLLAWLLALIFRLDTAMFKGKARKPFQLSVGVIVMLYSGMTWAAGGYWKNNLTLFERGVVTSPNSARTHYAYASECMKRSYTESDPSARQAWLSKSREHFGRCLEIYPDNYEALYNTGICMALSGDSISAIRAYTKAISLKGDMVNAMNNLGVVYEGVGQPDSAVRYYSMAMKVRPDQPVAVDNLSNLYYKKGLIYSQQGDKQNAIASYIKSISYKRDNVMALNNVASVYTGIQQYDSALVYLKSAYDTDRTNLMVIENIAAVSLLARDYDQALAFADKALVIRPGSPKSLGVQADAYQALGNPEKAAEIRRLINFAP